MAKLKRADFIKKLGIASAGALTFSACSNIDQSESINSISTKSYSWKMVTTWPPNFPVLGESANMFSKLVEALSGGRMKITVYGGGELVPALEAFDAVSGGAAEMASGAAYYWAGKSQACQFFATVPFGMNAQQMNSWLYAGGGLELWEELYAGFNLVPFPAGNTGVQMGGWFNKEIKTMADLKGLKMRIPGLGGKVLEKAGGTAVISAGGEIYTNLERGVIDATEWIGPYHDYLMGFYKIANYYYSPGWHEPGSTLEYFANKRKFDKLPADLQAIIRTASAYINSWVLSEFEAKNHTYLTKMVEEENVEIKSWPSPVLKELKEISLDVISEICQKDSKSRKIYEAYSSFQKSMSKWSSYSEKAFFNSLQG
jgi:TRAP-type mannitol/chloroaromatic compound transport system substrate-binding protein